MEVHCVHVHEMPYMMDNSDNEAATRKVLTALNTVNLVISPHSCYQMIQSEPVHCYFTSVQCIVWCTYPGSAPSLPLSFRGAPWFATWMQVKWQLGEEVAARRASGNDNGGPQPIKLVFGAAAYPFAGVCRGVLLQVGMEAVRRGG